MRSAASGVSSSTSEIARAMARGSRASRRSASEGCATELASDELAADHQALDLARAFADRAQLDVAEELLRRVILHESVSPMDLHALFGRTHGNLTGIELGNRRLERRALDLLIAHP